MSRQRRLYALTVKVDGKRKRVSQNAYTHRTAVLTYQNALISGSLAGLVMELRPTVVEHDPDAMSVEGLFRLIEERKAKT